MLKFKFRLAFVLSAICAASFFYSCDDTTLRACTEEFRWIQVTLKESDSTFAEVDSFFVVNSTSFDTIISHLDTIFHTPVLHGITIFTDNELEFTNEEGKEFRFTAYQNANKVVEELYVIRHDECHIDLVSGEIEVYLD